MAIPWLILMFATCGCSENLVESAGGRLSGFSDQYRSENTLGEYTFGYNEDHTTGGSFRRESSDRFGNKVGSYGLRVADGRVRIVNYVADQEGFRADVTSNEPGVQSQNSNQHSKITKKGIYTVVVPEMRYSSEAPHLTFETHRQIKGDNDRYVHPLVAERVESPEMFDSNSGSGEILDVYHSDTESIKNYDMYPSDSESGENLDAYHSDSESGEIHDKRNKDGLDAGSRIDGGIMSAIHTVGGDNERNIDRISVRSQKNDDFKNLRNDYLSKDDKGQIGVNLKVKEIQALNRGKITGDVRPYDDNRNPITDRSQIYSYVNFNIKEGMENIDPKSILLSLRNDGDFIQIHDDISSKNDQKFRDFLPAQYDTVHVDEDVSHHDKHLVEDKSVSEDFSGVDRSEYRQGEMNEQFVTSQRASIGGKDSESHFRMSDDNEDKSRGLIHDLHMLPSERIPKVSHPNATINIKMSHMDNTIKTSSNRTARNAVASA